METFERGVGGTCGPEFTCFISLLGGCRVIESLWLFYILERYKHNFAPFKAFSVVGGFFLNVFPFCSFSPTTNAEIAVWREALFTLLSECCDKCCCGWFLSEILYFLTLVLPSPTASMAERYPWDDIMVLTLNLLRIIMTTDPHKRALYAHKKILSLSKTRGTTLHQEYFCFVIVL